MGESHNCSVWFIPVISLLLTNTYRGCRLAYPYDCRGFVRTKMKTTVGLLVLTPRWVRGSLKQSPPCHDNPSLNNPTSGIFFLSESTFYMSCRPVLSKQNFAQTHVHQRNKSTILGNMANMASERVVQFGTLKFLLFTHCTTRLTDLLPILFC